MKFPFQKKKITNEDQIDGGFLLSALRGQTTITRETALSLPVVAHAVDRVCYTVAGLPIKLYKEKNGKIEEVQNDIRVSLLNDDTGDTLDGFQFKRALVEDYLLGKGGFAVIERRANRCTGLYYVKENHVSISKNTDPVHKAYAYTINGKQYKNYEIMKILRNSRDGIKGESVTAEISKAIETAYRTMVYQLMLVQTGGNKKGFLTTENKLDKDSIAALREAWRRLYSNDSENVVVLNKGMTFKESSNTAVDMQLNQTMEMLGKQINDIFGIYEDDAKTIKYGIAPILTQIESALNKYLLLEKEKTKYYFAFDLNELLKGSLTERFNAYHVALSDGWMSRNEVRYAENRDLINGLDTFNLSLGAVLYDPETETYFTPNTGAMQEAGIAETTEEPKEPKEQATQEDDSNNEDTENPGEGGENDE